ncbi:hypothetical protein BDV06DRAFT_184893 [Aspergillus oleicola]
MLTVCIVPLTSQVILARDRPGSKHGDIVVFCGSRDMRCLGRTVSVARELGERVVVVSSWWSGCGRSGPVDYHARRRKRMNRCSIRCPSCSRGAVQNCIGVPITNPHINPQPPSLTSLLSVAKPIIPPLSLEISPSTLFSLRAAILIAVAVSICMNWAARTWSITAAASSTPTTAIPSLAPPTPTLIPAPTTRISKIAVTAEFWAAVTLGCELSVCRGGEGLESLESSCGLVLGST